MQNDLAALNAEEDAKMSVAENRRLRGEVRRLRRVIRDVRKCGCAGIGCHAELGAALAPRRKKP